jgi:hypothetical protein
VGHSRFFPGLRRPIGPAVRAPRFCS